MPTEPITSVRSNAAAEPIPRAGWEEFLQRFSTLNSEAPVRIRVAGGSAGGTGLLAEWQPLLDVTLDDEAGVPVIAVECGDPSSIEASGIRPHALRHLVRDPTGLWARRSGPEGWDALEIESPEGSVIVSLGSPAEGASPGEDAEQELMWAGRRGKLQPEEA